MNWIKICLSAWILILVIMINQVQSSGLFELRLKYFNNDNGRDHEGNCCSGELDPVTGKCSGTCKTRFRVCLKHYQAKIDTTSQCTYGDVVTPVLGENSVNLTSNLNGQKMGFINPIPFPFNFAWPGTFTLIVEAWHDTNETNARSPGVLILRLSIQRVLEVSSDWTEDKHESQYSWLQYDFRVTCDANYYGSGCANLCRPRDDQFGHYTCSETGEIVCISGWQGDYCSKARCLKNCNEQHGSCNRPNECSCSPGWKGPTCNECEIYPGCVHGTCKKPWECICNEGWGGLFCNQDLNYCTNHQPCQNGGTCFNTGQGLYTCQCPPGFTGSDCETEVSDCVNSPCLNSGTCIEIPANKSYKCECPRGWTGKYCENKTITCSDKPCVHGKCKDTTTGFKCECPPGYSGRNCEVQIDDCNPNPCNNGGTCLTVANGMTTNRMNSNYTSNDANNNHNGGLFQCVCPPGFLGNTCEMNIDDCQDSPCQNGGTCIDMVNQFRCQCVPGYIGSVCEEKVNICLTKPCANGGSCTNLNNDYRCTCRPGFTGRDCSIDIDECSSMPCRNGGTCVNRVNSFQCVCPGGFRGHQCEDEEYSSATFDARQFEAATHSPRSDGLTGVQVVLIAILSVAMPVIAVIAACVVICMKRKRKRAQEKDDAEARKQNEQNASATLHHGASLSSKRSSSIGIGGYDNGNPTITIKNTWDKSVNNIPTSASVDDCLMNTSLYGAMSNYSDNNNANSDCFASSIMPQLQRAKSQKQLNTDPSLMHRASQIIGAIPAGITTTANTGGGAVPVIGGTTGATAAATKEYMLDSKRISVLSDPATFCNPRWPTTPSAAATTVTSVTVAAAAAAAVQAAQHHQQQQQISQRALCSAAHM